jgi:hypothetical protein
MYIYVNLTPLGRPKEEWIWKSAEEEEEGQDTAE